MYIISYEPGHDFFSDGEIVGSIPDIELIKELRYKNDGKAFVLIDEESALLEASVRDTKLKVN